jgi:hypothetical protein
LTLSQPERDDVRGRAEPAGKHTKAGNPTTLLCAC